MVLDGLKRLLCKPVSRKEPITPEILSRIVQTFDKDNLKDYRCCTMLLIAFAGFLRFNELASLRLCDIDMNPSHVKLFIVSSKTDQFREGAWVVITATGSHTCPVNMLLKYLNCAGVTDFSSQDFLFKPITLFKSDNTYRFRAGSLSYTRCSEILK